MRIEKYLNYITNDPTELVYNAREKRNQFYSNRITFSRNVFVPITHQCRNRCGYCSFVSDDVNTWITPESYQKILFEAKEKNCSEVLLTLGEKPEEKYASARKFLAKHGFETTVQYTKYFCDKALESNLLPHSNLGILTFEELRFLKDSNASMGLMLETSSERLMQTIAHKNSPGKNPNMRLETIEAAGKLEIPFTTGILVGIGETWKERIESLMKLSHP